MPTTNEKTVSILNNLIQTCLDGEEGFRTAAEAVENGRLRLLFTEFSQQRAQLAAELQQEVHRLGDVPESSGSMSAAMHRGWMNLKSVVAGNDEAAIVAECERGEDSAVEQYQEALQENLPAEVRQVVNRQFAAVKAVHDRVRDEERAHQRA